MLKTLKWIYDLGVRQERVRIAAHLQQEAMGARLNQEVVGNLFHEEMNRKRPGKTALHRLEFDKAVSNRVERIINDMFELSGEWISSASLMFPDDKHKGEI